MQGRQQSYCGGDSCQGAPQRRLWCGRDGESSGHPRVLYRAHAACQIMRIARRLTNLLFARHPCARLLCRQKKRGKRGAEMRGVPSCRSIYKTACLAFLSDAASLLASIDTSLAATDFPLIFSIPFCRVSLLVRGLFCLSAGPQARQCITGWLCKCLPPLPLLSGHLHFPVSETHGQSEQ